MDELTAERIAALRALSIDAISYIGTQLERNPHRNFIGDELAPDLLARMNKCVAGDREGLSAFESAQLQELAFWRWVAFVGYNGEDPRVFPYRQRLFMTETFWRTGWELASLKDSKALEVGCGPLGMIEVLPCRSGVAMDPLNDHYSTLFSKVRSKNVRYETGFDRIPDRDFDFMVCHNVIDHTDDPALLFNGGFDRLLPGGRFLFQVNLSRTDTPRTDEHKSMHPSPIVREQVTAWLSQKSKDFATYVVDKPSTDGEFYFLAWGTKRADDTPVAYDKRA